MGQKVYRIGTGSKYGTTDLSSLSTFTVTEQGDGETLGSDGKAYAQKHLVDNLRWTITIEGTDSNIHLDVGDNQELVLVAAERDQGKDNITASGITYTFDDAVVESCEAGINHAGSSSLSISLVAVSDDGDTNPCLIT